MSVSIPNLARRLQQPDVAGLTDADAAATLGAASSRPRSRFVSYRTVYNLLGKATANAVSAAVQAADPLAHQMLLVPGDENGSGGGIDISLQASRDMIGQLQIAGVLTADQAAEMLALGVEPVAAEFPGLAEADVAKARTYELLLGKVRTLEQTLVSQACAVPPQALSASLTDLIAAAGV